MQRLVSIVLGLAVVVLAAVLAVKSAPTRAAIAASEHGEEDAAAGVDASSTSAASGASPGAASAAPALLGGADDGGLVLLSDLAALAPPDAGSALPANAPRQVRFGVVLVTYDGAQGAPPHARSKADARALADKLASEAKTDFHAAVTKGDPGSADDLGHMQRGVLEPPLEVELFTLPVGGVGEVVETPRGYWIPKRLE